MSPRPRIKKRSNWPENLHEPRPGYFTWRDPRDKKTHILGRIPLAQAIHEVTEANVIVAKGKVTKTLAERISEEGKTVTDLIARMSTDIKASTLASRKYHDEEIKRAFGSKECRDLTVTDASDLVEALRERGKLRWAQAVRTRLIKVCAKGVALGWMEKNVAEITEKVAVKVQRQRLTWTNST
ncbi:phage integrase Arm DNA-binding domain-containing protein [Paraburkholderia acidisoli]|uniref:Integrase lambda-type N-terminal DNA-binding domain-containing protein n=1 Tax=Paraburkholderia acidisoli TaxID=2571748 RepID=A0A7Z2GQX0_9BURK|nr:phage integrase Arm DNA-binding domain-containing protein [Paraburkholderia acidisoli]QGZ66331.1 hypothetical protein FAZ98_31550 [Paraburkholderia acidisoli]